MSKELRKTVEDAAVHIRGAIKVLKVAAVECEELDMAHELWGFSQDLDGIIGGLEELTPPKRRKRAANSQDADESGDLEGAETSTP